jgi:DNA-binding transcriptional ArsR family regulator
MDDTYELETVEQLKAIADELRQRVLSALTDQAMTVTQLGDRLGIAPAKAHYHVRELERVRLVKLVQTREKGGILEKYYRPIARDLTVPRSLLRSLPPDELLATTTILLDDIRRSFGRAAARAKEEPLPGDVHAAISRLHLWLTDVELLEMMRGIEDAVRAYQKPRGVPGERERSFAQLIYDSDLAVEEDTEPSTAHPTRPDTGAPKRRRTVAIAALHWNRAELEHVVVQGETLDITSIGVQSFADDVTPELADRAIARFRHRGPVRATPAVRAVLKEKEKTP